MTAALLLFTWLLAAPADAQQAPPSASGVQAPAVPGGLAEPPAFAPPDPATAQERTRDIGSGLRCPVCQGLSVADSNANSAQVMFDRIGELVRLGYSKQQIEDYFVERYGEWVLLAPPAEGLHWIIWLGPVVAFVIGAGGIGLRARRASHTPVSAPVAAAPSSDPYRDRILAELEGAEPPKEAP